MKNLTTNIDVVNAISRITKWEVTRFNEDAAGTVQIGVNLYGPGNALFQALSLIFNGTGGSSVSVNPSPQGISDQIGVAFVANATIAQSMKDSYYGAGGGRNSRLNALEDSLLSLTVLSSDFAGT